MYSIEQNHVELTCFFLSIVPPSRVDFQQYYRLPEVVEDLGVNLFDGKSPTMREVDAATSATRCRKKPKS
jgi:hypothetical protein